MGVMEQLLLARLKKQNPRLYEIYRETRESGRDPYDVMAEMYAEHKIDDNDLNMVASKMKAAGRPISDEDMERIRKGQTKAKKKGSDDYSGLF